MFGTLRKIKITENLIIDVAREMFVKCNDETLDNQNNYVKGMWHDSACETLEDFNNTIKIFKKINYGCDVEEFYKD